METNIRKGKRRSRGNLYLNQTKQIYCYPRTDKKIEDVSFETFLENFQVTSQTMLNVLF